MKSVRQAIIDGHFVLDVEARSMGQILRHAVSHLVVHKIISVDQRDEVEQALLARERQASTALGHAVAVPHAYLDAIAEPVILLMRLARPVNLGAPDGVSTRFVFVLLGPPDHAAEHLDALAAIARLMSDSEFQYDAGRAAGRHDLLSAVERFTVRTAPAPERAAVPISEGLRYTGRFCGGLIDDVRRRLPHYVSDFRDALHPKCVGATLFLFFACLAPAVTFGGVMAVETGGAIGAVEMILATALCGVIFALFSGQPMIVLGGTGPLLIFTAMLYQLCGDFGIPFLPTYVWVGMWTAMFVLLLAATDASALMRYFTRFTDEIFAGLISLIFIYEAIKGLVHIFQHLDVKTHHDTALLSLLLALGTLYIANILSNFRRSRYLLPQVREFLADFGPTIALAAMTLVAVWMHEVYLEALPAPETFGTTSGRAWLINPLDAPRWIWLAAAVPAMLGTVLVFLDQNITSRLVNSADHHLQKGEAYHLDLAVVGVLVGVCSLIGLPWLVAATVRSLNHLRSLATFDEVVLPSGDRQDRVVHVRENRVTALAIHALIGLCLLLLPVLKLIPMAVLFGLFLYMGIVSMKGNQFFERLNLWLMDSALYPSTHYIRKLKNSTIHRYTLIQFANLVVLWIVKSSPLGILFPLFIAMLVPIRSLVVGRLFTPQQLAVLDADETPEEEITRVST
jgi:mannitol/fructose-specific phosphotransferase system IIA component (Ntr-type)